MQTGVRRGLGKLGLDLQRVGLYATIGDPGYYAKTFFFATDDPVPNTGTQYWSDGTAWYRIGGTKTEIARASLTTNGPNTSSTTISDITGLSITFTLTTARAVEVELVTLMTNSAADYIVVYLTDSAGTTQYVNQLLPPAALTAGANTGMPPCKVRLDLTAGAYTIKARQQALISGTVHSVAAANSPSQLFATAL